MLGSSQPVSGAGRGMVSTSSCSVPDTVCTFHGICYGYLPLGPHLSGKQPVGFSTWNAQLPVASRVSATQRPSRPRNLVPPFRLRPRPSRFSLSTSSRACACSLRLPAFTCSLVCFLFSSPNRDSVYLSLTHDPRPAPRKPLFVVLPPGTIATIP